MLNNTIQDKEEINLLLIGMIDRLECCIRFCDHVWNNYGEKAGKELEPTLREIRDEIATISLSYDHMRG